MRHITIEWVNNVPPAKLRGNSRLHPKYQWFLAQANIESSFGWDVRIALMKRNDLPLLFECADIEYTFRLPANRRRDPDNYITGMKHFLDYLVKEAQILVDDSADRLTILPPRFEKGPERTLITIRERRLSAKEE